MFGHGYFGAGWFGSGYWGPGADVVDTHDGGDDRRRQREAEKRSPEQIKRFRRDREHLRAVIREAFDGPPEVRAIVAPFVAADEPITAQAHIDYGALLMAADTLRALADWQERIAYERSIDDDDEEVLLLI